MRQSYEILRKNKKIVDQKDKNGNTALHLAIQNDYIDIIKLLILFDIDINLPDGF